MVWEVVDPHHHYLDTREGKDGGNSTSFQAFLATFVANTKYLPGDYQRDVIQELEASDIKWTASVHVECIPNQGVEEVEWVKSLVEPQYPAQASGIVASCNLVDEDARAQLERLSQTSPRVKGIRWLLDCADPEESVFVGGTATHMAVQRHTETPAFRRHGTLDYLSPKCLPEFEKGYQCLQEFGLSYDLHCAPVQLPRAAELMKRYPKTPVCINHLGKPRLHELKSVDELDASAEYQSWKTGMTAMAQLDHVYCKISMLGYAVPGWCRDENLKGIIQRLVQEVYEMFGPHRCMVAFNWWKSAGLSDSDGLSDVGPSPTELVQTLLTWLPSTATDEEKQAVLAGTARKFYRI